MFKMKKRMIGGWMLILCAATVLVGCEKKPKNDDSTETAYKWSTDSGIKACDHILFTDGKEDPKGKEIGDGDQEFVFTGKQTLKKGTYLLKGWVYIGNGAELTIAPGSVIKGDKITKAALIAERGGKLIARGTAAEPIVFTSAQPAGSRKPGDWGGIILCGKAPIISRKCRLRAAPAPSTVAI